MLYLIDYFGDIKVFTTEEKAVAFARVFTCEHIIEAEVDLPLDSYRHVWKCDYALTALSVGGLKARW